MEGKTRCASCPIRAHTLDEKFDYVLHFLLQCEEDVDVSDLRQYINKEEDALRSCAQDVRTTLHDHAPAPGV